ncbi:PREDICTED: beta-1,4 N-acetylgalactosaminyltransferase 2 [Chrysochloris asiatica]|uniref:Beta-1,4 N-acetylgalactosaminyltransferase n=1 Tax=Chrysochloris asiatica TaxID=185453 RepID=A0A9B0WFA9_CHRAS|nr:PREDICTED: beta-1,4 N-acetylgalactosaminyltransferase 2 [Chrysochloris asiatica]
MATDNTANNDKAIADRGPSPKTKDSRITPMPAGRSEVLHIENRNFNPKLKHPAPAAPMLKLLPEKHLRNLFTYDGIWLFPKNQCKCETTKWQTVMNFQNAYNENDLPGVNARRQAEYEHFQRREGLPHPPPLLAQPNLPFGYPVYGVEVMPLHTVPIPGLQFDGPDAHLYEVTLTATLGTLNTLADTPDSVVHGRGQKQLIISTSNRELLNFILQHVTYTSTVYQPKRVDMVSLEWNSSVVKFPVIIHQPIIPKLYDPGPERKLRDLVTIATKTFLRPQKFMILLQSIRKYYPDLTVIVADDSKEPLKINDSHVEYYTMPFGKGWFAGRNLAISQVTTKYVLWVDDDFLFNDKTKIEVLVDVLEKTELDVVGGSVLGNVFQFKLLLEQGENGDCIHRKTGSFRPLDNFPNCVVTSVVVNFFLAHTEQLRKVGFDPRLQRVAHSEFFIDGLGSLFVGSCPEVIVSHQPHSKVLDWKMTDLEKTYRAYRTNTKAQIQFKLALHYFKNHLQCST